MKHYPDVDLSMLSLGESSLKFDDSNIGEGGEATLFVP